MILLIATRSFGQVSNEHYANHIKGDQIGIDSTFIVIDDKWNSPVWNSIIQHNLVSNSVALEINFNSGLAFPSNFVFTAEVEITAWDSAGNQNVEQMSLRISYDSLNIDSSAFISLYEFNDYHKVSVKVVSLEYTESDSVFNVEDIPHYFRLSSSIDLQRVYNFDCNGSLTVYHGSLSELESVMWLPYSGATDYDVEWTFYSSSSDVGKKILNNQAISSGSLPVLFENNATRVNVKNVYFLIPKVYSDGYIFIRIRAAATLSDNDRAVSIWKYVNLVGNTVTPFSVNWHEQKFNFKYDATFAEEGKLVESVEYYDGSLKNRQTVNRFERYSNPSPYSSSLLVSETIYDQLGRPAVKVLPAPPKLSTEPLKYFNGFNNSNTGSPYDYSNFESGDCNEIPDDMKNNSGSSLYYSTQNAGNLFNENMLPDANGYPFSVTEYKNDNTGRLSRQGNVGEALQIGSGHETKYYYGTPGQDELDIIFGSDAGECLRYTKEMVIDPNNTTSITLKDEHNRVVATALAGDVPSTMNDIAVTSVYPTPEQAEFVNTINVLSNASLNGTSIVANATVLLPAIADITLNFNLEGDSVKTGCDTYFCYDCLYDIHIKVSGSCEDGLLVDEWLHNYNFESGFSAECNGPASLSPFTYILEDKPAGEYQITCEIKVSESALAYYKQHFIAHNTCLSLEEMIHDATSSIDLTGCYTSCEECLASLGTLEQFQLNYITEQLENGITGDAEVMNAAAAALYDEFIADCNTMCGDENICNETYALMLDDMSPGGQYAKYTDENEVITCSDSASIFYGTAPYRYQNALFVYKDLDENDMEIPAVVTIDGIDYSPNQLSPADFITYFNPHWANELVKLHPEYCYYEFCTSTEAENQYKLDMMKIETYAEAVAGNWLHAVNGPILNDPLLTNNISQYQSFIQELQTKVEEYLVGSYTNPHNSNQSCTLPEGSLSIWDIAMLTGLSIHHDLTSAMPCSLMTHSNIQSLFTYGGTGISLCAADRDQAWKVFRAIYLQLRDKCMSKMEAAFVTDMCSTEVKCVACVDNDNINSNPFITGCNVNIGSSETPYKNFGFHLDPGCDNSVIDDNVKNKIPRWFNYTASANAASFTSWSSGNTYTTDNLEIHCAQMCSSYVDRWEADLSQCAFGTSGMPSQTDFITDLYNVCINACDLQHPLGASDFPLDSCNFPPCTELSFAMVFDKYNIDINSVCNPGLLTQPAPYIEGWEQSNMPQIIYDSIPPCVCDRVEEYKTLCNCTTATAMYAYFTSTFSLPPFSVGQLENMMNWCSGNIACLEIGDGLELPQYLNCQTCIDCDTLSDLVPLITDQYIAALTPMGPVGLDGYYQYLTYNLNFHFGKNATVDEYKEMIKHCGISLYNHSCISYTYLYDCFIHPDFAGDEPYALYMNLQYMENLTCDEWASEIGSRDCPFTLPPCSTLVQTGTPPCSTLTAAIENYLYYNSLPGTGQEATYLDAITTLFRSYWTGITNVTTYMNAIASCTGHSVTIPSNPTTNDLLTIKNNLIANFGNVYFDAPIKPIWLWLAHYPGSAISDVEDLYDDAYKPQNATAECNDLDALITNYNYNSVNQLFTEFTNDETQQSFTDFDYDMWIKLCDKGSLFMLCTDPILPTINSNVFPTCLEEILQSITANITLEYEHQVEMQAQEFETRFIQKCMNPLISFTAAHPLHQYHYTLYYYDQAGNLVKTVAPQGVRILDNTALNNVRSFRTTNTGTGVFPLHQFDTKYWYNSLNQVIKQWTPDANYTWFWYDNLGRIILSQNSRQKPLNLYSYSNYDNLNRIVETGQVELTSSTIEPEDPYDVIAIRLGGPTYHTDVVKTWYDSPKYSNLPITQKNLRHRIASVTFEKIDDIDDNTYDHATHYSYDMQGNVGELVQDNPTLASIDQQFKTIKYKYDLVSGKVNYVNYQQGEGDHFDYKYQYDSRNRLIDAQSSNNYGTTWEHDARYSYWRHGPLKRTILGERQVQGMDYVYTLQGWLKGMNYATADPDHDVSGDGKIGSVVARDAFAQALGYFEDDYVSLSGEEFYANATASGMRATPNLYNGNIRYQQVGFYNDKGSANAMGYGYKYDLLNRLRESQPYTSQGYDYGTTEYKMELTYDGNGNILTLMRNGSNPIAIDNLTYNYASNTITDNSGTYTYPTNKLQYVNDPISASAVDFDIDEQNPDNYTYDESGNLIGDLAESLTIQWNNLNKISQINCTKSGAEYVLTFNYDALGNRIEKSYYDQTTGNTSQTFYIRDAQGNVLATYDWLNNDIFTWREQMLYGSSRLGTYHPEMVLYDDDGISTPPPTSRYFLDRKVYEVTDHLGNVTATVSDYSQGIDADNSGTVDYYIPTLRSLTDYYPFGMQMPDRTETYEGYRYGFNGKENDNEVKGSGNQLDYGFRIYDPRLCRFLSVDPLTKEYPWYTPYQFSGNKPIWCVDIDGLEEGIATMFMVNNWEEQQKRYTSGEVSYEELALQRDNQSKATFIGAVGGLVVNFVMRLPKPVLNFIREELIENAIESLTGIPVIVNPMDVLEQAGKKGLFKGVVTDKLKEKEIKRAAEIIKAGEGVLVQIPRRPGTLTADFLLNGKKIEFKSLDASDKVNINTGITRLKDATKKTDVEIIDLDVRPSNGNVDDAKKIFDRFKKTEAGKQYKGSVRIATNEGLVTF